MHSTIRPAVVYLLSSSIPFVFDASGTEFSSDETFLPKDPPTRACPLFVFISAEMNTCTRRKYCVKACVLLLSQSGPWFNAFRKWQSWCIDWAGHERAVHIFSFVQVEGVGDMTGISYRDPGRGFYKCRMCSITRQNNFKDMTWTWNIQSETKIRPLRFLREVYLD